KCPSEASPPAPSSPVHSPKIGRKFTADAEVWNETDRPPDGDIKQSLRIPTHSATNSLDYISNTSDAVNDFEEETAAGVGWSDSSNTVQPSRSLRQRSVHNSHVNEATSLDPKHTKSNFRSKPQLEYSTVRTQTKSWAWLCLVGLLALLLAGSAMFWI